MINNKEELDELNFPNNHKREECLAAVCAVRDYLRQRRVAKREDFIIDIMPKFPAGYDANKLRQTLKSDNIYQGGWWNRVLKPGLKILSDIEESSEQANYWVYTAETIQIDDIHMLTLADVVMLPAQEQSSSKPFIIGARSPAKKEPHHFLI